MTGVRVLIHPGTLKSSDALTAWTERALAPIQRRFERRVTRIEVHLAEMSAPRGVGEVRCAMEARVNGRPPIAVEQRGFDVYLCVTRAARKLLHAVEHALDRTAARAGRFARVRAARPSAAATAPGRYIPGRSAGRERV